MTTTDPTITIAGLRAQVSTLIDHLDSANTSRGEFSSLYSQHSAKVAAVEAERDALAAQLAEARAALAAAPKVFADDCYADACRYLDCTADNLTATVASLYNTRAKALSDLASERAHLAACQTRIAGLEQAADERSRTGQMSEPERSEWIGAAVAVADALGGSLGPVSGTIGAIDPREWIHFAEGLADRAKKLTARVAELEARPVLTEDRLADAMAIHGTARKVFAHLAPVTLPLPAQDPIGAPPTSPPDARPVFAGVSVEELARVFWCATGRGYKPEQWETLAPSTQAEWIKGIRAVLDRLEVSLVAPVDPEEVARDFYIRLSKLTGSLQLSAHTDGDRRDRIETMRATLIARGIPVTPEAGK